MSMTDQDNNHEQTAEPIDEAALNEEASRELAAMVAEAEGVHEADGPDDASDETVYAPKTDAERLAIIETLIFVSDEPLTSKTIADVLKQDRE